MDKVTQVIAWALTVTFAVVILMGTYDANALTLKKGEVLTSNGVVHASESATTQALVERNGFAITAGLVILEGGATIELESLKNKSNSDIKEIVGNALVGDSIASSIEAQIADGVSREVAEQVVAKAITIAEAAANGLADEVHDAIIAKMSAECYADDACFNEALEIE